MNLSVSLVKVIRNSLFRKEESGFAATEFAILVPVLLALFLGGVSAFDANRAAANLAKASTTMVDLATRQAVMTDQIRDSLFATVEAIAGKYANGSDFSIVVTSIENPFDVDNEDDLIVVWSEATVPSKVLEDDDIDDLDLPTIPEGNSVIVVMVETTYSPILGWKVVRPWKLKRTSIRLPRFVSVIRYLDE